MPGPGSAHLFYPQGSSSAGGGGTSLLWSEQANAPIFSNENNVDVYRYSHGESQILYTAIKVPSSYTLGNPITLKIQIFSPGLSDDIKIETLTTLIRPGTDKMNTTTNQHASTNSEITLNGSNDNTPLDVTLDLTDGSGEINSVAVSPDDLLIVALARGTDTSVEDIRFILCSGEISFT